MQYFQIEICNIFSLNFAILFGPILQYIRIEFCNLASKMLDICKFRKNRVSCGNYLSKMSKLEKSMLEFGLNILPERNSYDKNATTRDTRCI